MKQRTKIVFFVIVSIAIIGLTHNNSKFSKLLDANIEALTDSYEDKTDWNGHLLSVYSIGRKLTNEEMENLKGEMYYISHGLPNPYHWMFTSYNPYSIETFYNLTKSEWEDVARCGSDKSLCSGEIYGYCWAMHLSF